MIRASDAINAARALIGTPYSELDCINLIKKIIRTAPGGVKGYQTAGTASLWASGGLAPGNKYRDLTERSETISGAKPGMLAFKGKPLGRDGQPQHVGLVTERGTVIHASSVYGKVVETPLTAKEGWTLTAIHRYIEPEVIPMQTMNVEGLVPSIPAKGRDNLAPQGRVAKNTQPQGGATVATPNGGKLNLRAGPGKAYKAIATIPNGETLEALGEAADGWLQVQWNGYAGYVSADMVQMDDGAGGTSCQIWYVHVPCQNRQQAEALADLIPGAIAVVSSGND